MTTVADGVKVARLVRLHVAGGRVWQGRDAVVTGGPTVAEFLGDVDDDVTYRLLGTSANAGLIVGLHERRARLGLDQRIELFSPAALTGRHLTDAAVVLQFLWQPDPASLANGGCHCLSPWDFTAYAVAADLGDPTSTPRAIRTMRCHPAWPAISFLPFRRDHAAARMLSDILDPRWFRDPSRPHRASRLL